MTKELPARANLEHLKSQAKDLLDAFKRREPAALARFRQNLPSARGAGDEVLSKTSLALHDAQSVIAREYGFPSFAALKAAVERRELSPEALRALMERLKGSPLPDEVALAVHAAANAGAAPVALEFTGAWPVVPVRNAVATVGAVLPLGIGRPTSVAAVRAAERAQGLLALFTQRDQANEAPGVADLHPVGCAARVLKTLHLPERGFWIVVRAQAWIVLEAIERAEPYVVARVKPFEILTTPTDEVKALESRVRERVKAHVATLPEAETLLRMTERMNTLELADAAVANLPASIEDKARYAAEANLAGRLRRVLELFEAAR